MAPFSLVVSLSCSHIGVIHELGHSTIQIMTHGMEKDYIEATAEE